MGISCMTQGTQTGLCNNLKGVGWGGRREGVSEGGDICILISDSCWYLGENNKIR